MVLDWGLGGRAAGLEDDLAPSEERYVFTLPLNEHRHDDALVRKGMRAFSRGARALTPSNELLRGQPRRHSS